MIIINVMTSSIYLNQGEPKVRWINMNTPLAVTLKSGNWVRILEKSPDILRTLLFDFSQLSSRRLIRISVVANKSDGESMRPIAELVFDRRGRYVQKYKISKDLKRDLIPKVDRVGCMSAILRLMIVNLNPYFKKFTVQPVSRPEPTVWSYWITPRPLYVDFDFGVSVRKKMGLFKATSNLVR